MSCGGLAKQMLFQVLFLLMFPNKLFLHHHVTYVHPLVLWNVWPGPVLPPKRFLHATLLLRVLPAAVRRTPLQRLVAVLLRAQRAPALPHPCGSSERLVRDGKARAKRPRRRVGGGRPRTWPVTSSTAAEDGSRVPLCCGTETRRERLIQNRILCGQSARKRFRTWSQRAASTAAEESRSNECQNKPV